MKNWFWIPLAAIAGLVAGSWGPREDLAKFKENVREAETQQKVSGMAGFDAFAKLANIPDVAKRRPKARTNELARSVGHSVPASAGKAETNEDVVAEIQLGTDPDAPKSKIVTTSFDREGLEARLEEAAELWNTRVELAKTQWKGKLGIKDGKASEAFDAAVATMNESIRDTMAALAEEIEQAGKVNAELSVRMMGDFTRNLAEAYDAIGAAVPPERRAEVSEMPVHEFIDPMVAEPLIGVQDKLEGGFHMGPRE